jgi:hypothetical protein
MDRRNLEERKRHEHRERECRERERLTVRLKPSRVPIRHALVLLGNMSRSVFYDKAHLFDLYKEGTKTTVGVASIDRYNASLPRARIGGKQAAGA